MRFFILLYIAASISNIFPQSKYNLHLYLKVYLQGDYQNGKMLTTLNEKNLIPLKQPYSSSPWNYSGGEKVNAMPANVSDWILIEFAAPDYKEKICRACLLNSNGNVSDTDGSNYVKFDNIAAGEYYVIIYHRNHLPLVTSAVLEINSDSLRLDFTKSDSVTANSLSVTDLGDGNLGMISGDGNSDGKIDKSDLMDIAKDIFKLGYYNCDLDMNGIVNVLDYERAQRNLMKKTLVKLSAN
jgi:hypothetical protein